MSDPLQLHELQHARLPCPSLSPGACSNSRPLSRWWHLTILSNVVPFSSCLQSFPAFSLFQWVNSSHQVSKYWSFSFSISPTNEYSGLISLRIDWLDLLAVQGTLKSLFQSHSSKASILRCSAFFIVQPSHPYMTTGKIITLTICTFVSKVMSLLFNMLSRFVIAFLPRSKRLFHFMAAVTIHSDFGAQENKVGHCFHYFPIYLPWRDGTGCHDHSFWMLNFKPAFSLSSFTFIRGFLVPLHFLPLELYHLHIWGCLYFSLQSWFQLELHPAQHFAWCTLQRS